jgi:hypothetical protein
MVSVTLARLLVGGALLSGCLVGISVPDIPATTRPDLPADKFLEVDANTATVQVTDRVKTGETCVKGSRDCVTHHENRERDVDVRVAKGTIDGRPVTLRELAVMASPDFVKDTDRVAGLMSACRRGRISMSLGLTAAIVGATLLQRAFDEEDPSRNMAIGGYAALGAGVVGLVGGYTVFGGQHCKEAGKLYERWKPVYKNPDDIEQVGSAAEMYEVLARKFNADREAALGRQSEAEVETTDR